MAKGNGSLYPYFGTGNYPQYSNLGSGVDFMSGNAVAEGFKSLTESLSSINQAKQLDEQQRQEEFKNLISTSMGDVKGRWQDEAVNLRDQFVSQAAQAYKESAGKPNWKQQKELMDAKNNLQAFAGKAKAVEDWAVDAYKKAMDLNDITAREATLKKIQDIRNMTDLEGQYQASQGLDWYVAPTYKMDEDFLDKITGTTIDGKRSLPDIQNQIRGKLEAEDPVHQYFFGKFVEKGNYLNPDQHAALGAESERLQSEIAQLEQNPDLPLAEQNKEVKQKRLKEIQTTLAKNDPDRIKEDFIKHYSDIKFYGTKTETGKSGSGSGSGAGGEITILYPDEHGRYQLGALNKGKGIEIPSVEVGNTRYKGASLEEIYPDPQTGQQMVRITYDVKDKDEKEFKESVKRGIEKTVREEFKNNDKDPDANKKEFDATVEDRLDQWSMLNLIKITGSGEDKVIKMETSEPLNKWAGTLKTLGYEMKEPEGDLKPIPNASSKELEDWINANGGTIR